MPYELRDNSGSIFKNDKREKETHPNATGTCMIDGVEYWISSWTKDGAKGKWQSLAFKRKEEKREAPSKDKPSEVPFEDDIPF
jgi:hypothetical protein